MDPRLEAQFTFLVEIGKLKQILRHSRPIQPRLGELAEMWIHSGVSKGYLLDA